jgi:hypothetical protein
MTIAPESTASRWNVEAIFSGRTAGAFATSETFPDEEREQRLMRNLVIRSTLKNGFDRRTLRNIDRDAWGISNR